MVGIFVETGREFRPPIAGRPRHKGMRDRTDEAKHLPGRHRSQFLRPEQRRALRAAAKACGARCSFWLSTMIVFRPLSFEK
jgi:hypothetical protein